MRDRRGIKKRKKTEHTRMYAQLCSSRNAIFTSVVVYSRTSPKTNQFINKSGFEKLLLMNWFVVESTIVVIDGKKRKKNGAHTHVRTTVQLTKQNIHVGCCLFSHNQSKKIKQKKENRVLSRKLCILFV